MGLLLTEGETKANYSKCAAILVVEYILLLFLNFVFFPQIGSNMFLTAAHCLQNWADAVQTPSQLKVVLGVQNRSKLTPRAK